MKHVHLISGGAGSWLASKVHLRDHAGEEHVFSFSDTLYEDADCYRFLLEGLCNLIGIDASWVPRATEFPDYRVAEDVPIEEYAGNPEWRTFLADLREEAAARLPQLAWLSDGRDVWEVFRDERFLGNSSVDPCSKVLKRKLRDKWMKANFIPAVTTIVIGIGPDEAHRFDSSDGKGFGPRMTSAGWHAAAPLIQAIEGQIGPFVYLEKAGIDRPRLYRLGYMHNNCGGYCCKAGQAHYKLRLRVQPERFAYDAMMERKIIAYLGSDVSMLTDRTGDGLKKPLTLDRFRERIESASQSEIDWLPGDSGCGCMIDPGAEDEQSVQPLIGVFA